MWRRRTTIVAMAAWGLLALRMYLGCAWGQEQPASADSPGQRTLASAVRQGTVEASATGTGETIGVVAQVKLHNNSDQVQSITIPPTVLIPKDGTSQNYAVPQATDVVLQPGQTRTVPLNGVCTQAHRPPAGPDTPGGISIEDPSDPQFQEKYQPELVCTQNVIKSAKELQDSGQIDTPFHNDPQKELQTIVQQTVWAANPTHDGRSTTKEDLARKVYEQTGATTEEQKKALQPGIDSIWHAVELTGVRAKVFEVGNGPGGDQTADEKPPAASEPSTVEKFPKYVPPKGGKIISDPPPDEFGDRTIIYEDENGRKHKLTIDSQGHAIEKYTLNGNVVTKEYYVHFDADGGRTETATRSDSGGGSEGSTVTKSKLNKDGVVVRETVTSTFIDTDTEGGGHNSERKVEDTQYDDNHVKKESTVTIQHYPSGQNPEGDDIVDGKRTIKKYSGPDDSKGTTTTETYDPKTKQFVPGK